jgi:hypothetical protein
MSFINEYNKVSSGAQPHHYTDSIKIGNFIYAIGDCTDLNIGSGLITKVDLSGTVIWEKTYGSGNNRYRAFHSILKCENDDFLITATNDIANSVYRNFVIRINSEGGIVWNKSYFPANLSNTSSSNLIIKLLKLDGENYIIYTHHPFIVDLSINLSNYHNHIIKIDGSGNIIKNINISSIKGLVSEFPYHLLISTNGSEILLACQIENKILCLVFDSNLNLTNKFGLAPASNSGIIDLNVDRINFKNGKIFVLGSVERTNTRKGFIANIDYPVSQEPNTGSIAIKTFENLDYFDLHSNSNYIYISFSKTLKVIKLDNDFNQIWFKIIGIPGTRISHVDSNNVVILGYGIPMIGLLNLDMDSCKTSNINLLPLVNESLDFNTNITTTVVNATINIGTVPLTISGVTSIKTEICPPVSEINAVNDAIGSINGVTGGSAVLNVLNNDTLNGNPVTPSSVTLTPVTAGPLTINSNGALSVAPNTPAGTYTIRYTICEIANPTNCDSATVTVTVEAPGPFIIKNSASIQSTHLYLQAAGSQGVDSTRGNHLRWMLKGALEKHLPKANYAVPNSNFNKQNDYVTIHKAPYIERKTTLNFNQPPGLVFDAKKSWVYSVDSYLFTVVFRNAQKYDSVRLTVNPTINPLLFIGNYGNELIEIESKTELSFAITTNFAVANLNGLVKVELLSVEDNKVSSPKYVSYRKSLTQESINNKKIFSENVKSIRFQSNLGAIERIDFELYTVQIQGSKDGGKWKIVGRYALSKDTNIVFKRLEPESGTVHGKWLRYNDNAYTNIDNYKEKWNGSSVVADEQIIKTVEKYITLSNNVSNPLANETIAFNGMGNEPIPGYTPDPDYNPNQSENFEISNLNLLQIGALDYHVARMLGLGVLDLGSDLSSQKHIYLAEYITYGDLEDGLGAREVQHLYCSLPTSTEDERLPLPIDLKAPVPGIFYGLDTEAPQLLTDDKGYSVDGRTRFLTLYHQELPEEIPNPTFFYTNREFISSQQTEPVYAGIEHIVHAGDTPTTWGKPELPFDPKFFNVDNSVTADKRNETVSILVPEPTQPLFVHRQKQEGKHHYGSYGINWFSRATHSTVRWNSVTVFPVVNFLLPPTNINALLIRKEAPLLLTSASEQVRLQNISDIDKTLIRLTFDYNHVQELKDYHKEINGELVNGYVAVADNEEQFAENIEIFFRDEVPYTISGKIVSVQNDASNEILAIVKTGVYTIISAGSVNNQIIPSFPNNNYSHFNGSVLLINDTQFIVHQAYSGANSYPEFKVFKRDANGPLNAFETNTPVGELESPVAGGIFVLVENMLSVASWGNPAPIAFKVQIDPQVANIHQEEILIVSPDALTVEKHVQKFRGIYRNATISKFIEDVEEYDDENDTTPTVTQKHLGVYKIEFNGFNLNQPIQN